MTALTFERVGDVIGCLFEGEDDVALFVPGSGDVLLSSLAQWRTLRLPVDLASGGQFGGVTISSDTSGAFPADGLKSTLLSLGAAIE